MVNCGYVGYVSSKAPLAKKKYLAGTKYYNFPSSFEALILTFCMKCSYVKFTSKTRNRATWSRAQP